MQNGTAAAAPREPSDRVRVSFAHADGETSAAGPPFVLVKYFLDRQGGYGIDNSSARIWRQPPPKCTASDVRAFLRQQGILPPSRNDDSGNSDGSSLPHDILAEVYLSEFTCYMLLDMCELEGITFDFSATSTQSPGVLNIRLTDVEVNTRPEVDAAAMAIAEEEDYSGTTSENSEERAPSGAGATKARRSKTESTSKQGGTVDKETMQGMAQGLNVPAAASTAFPMASGTPPIVLASPSWFGLADASQQTTPSTCSAVPIGLYAFSLTVLMEVIDLYQKLAGGVDESFVLTWGPYAFWISGFLQVLVGIMEWTRNNIYGATAFLAFGCFWLANGTKIILKNYFPGEIAQDVLEDDDPVGNFLRNLHILGFVCVLFKATLTMNRLSTTLISLLIVLLIFTSVALWDETLEWIQAISGTVVSLFAFYVFTAEFLNEVYHDELMPLYPWSTESPKEAFGAAGRSTKLVSAKATATAASEQATATAAMVVALRNAHAVGGTKAPASNNKDNSSNTSPSVHQLRGVQPVSEK